MGNCCFTPNPAVHNEVKSSDRGGGADEAASHGGVTETPSLKVFSMAELRMATGDFREESVVGEGGFGKVYRGYIDEKTNAPSRAGQGIPVAIKKSNPSGEQGLKEWKAEVKFLGKFKHPNLVKLVGFCWEEKQYLLVYQFMQGGSLENHLFPQSGSRTIPWDTRMKIAVGAATGLHFLHSTGDEKVIYRDFKASNILLDLDFNVKISDFGLAKAGPTIGNSHVTTQIVGTYGYAAPEYVATGHLYLKSDVYSFGVVLLELITGLRVHDVQRPREQVNLVDWAKPLLPHKRSLRDLIDPRLNGLYPSKGAHRMAKLILNCLEPEPKNRPSMREVLDELEGISKFTTNSNKSRSELNQARRCHRHSRAQGED